MAMNNMANMNTMGGPVGAPMPMMNNGAVAPPPPQRQLQVNDNNRTLLNTYIYEYFLRNGMFDCARAILQGDNQVKVQKDGRRDENGNPIGNGEDAMDTDSKDDIDSKRPEDLPAPNVPMPLQDSCFLYEWFCLFWDMFNAQKGKGASGQVNQYVSHTQAQSRMRQAHQQDMLRQMRPEFSQQQYQAQMMRNMQNGGMNLSLKQGNNLPRTAMANSQNNPQAMQMMAKQGQMQRDPSDMDGNRARPASPGSTENAPSPSKRPRLDGAPFNPGQGGMMPNGRPAGQGMPGQQVGTGPSTQQVQQMLLQNGINPGSLNPEQFQTFQNQSPAVQQKTIQTYAQNLQQHHGAQMTNKPMPNAAGPQGQGSPMVPQGPDGNAINAYYNAGDMGGPGAMRPGPGGAQAGGGSNHALQDYQMQLMLLEQQNKKRLMMARQEQDGIGGMPREGAAGPGGPPGPNGQPFQGTSPQGPRAGASPNPAEQMKRGGPQMAPAGMGSPLPEGAQSRGSPNAMNFMANQMDPAMAPHFFKDMNGMANNMVGAQMNGGMRPPSSHPGQPFNGPMNPQQQQQMMAAARQQQQQQAAQGGPQMQWPQGGPNANQMGPQAQPGQQVQGTPQQRAMPPPAQPAAANAAPNARNTSSPQTSNAAPPTPSQSNKAAPKKKDTKSAKDKRAAAQKKSNANLNNTGATPAAEPAAEPEPPTPATPITPSNPQTFNKQGQNAAPVQAAPNGQPAAPAPPTAAAMPPQPAADPNQMSFSVDSTGMEMGSFDFANPLTSDNVLNDFDFDSFLHDNDGDNGAFDFNATSFMEGGEIGAD